MHLYTYTHLAKYGFYSALKDAKYGNCDRLTEFSNSLPKIGPAHSAASGILENRSFTSQHETECMFLTTPITQNYNIFAMPASMCEPMRPF